MPKKTDVPSRIIRAAVALFSRQGYHGTSTRDIARLADVSEVTLYRYFEHKEDIFWAALASCFDALRPRLSALQPNGRNAAPQVFVPRILNILIDTATFSPELLRLIAVALLEVHGKRKKSAASNSVPCSRRSPAISIKTSRPGLFVISIPQSPRSVSHSRSSHSPSSQNSLTVATCQNWISTILRTHIPSSGLARSYHLTRNRLNRPVRFHSSFQPELLHRELREIRPQSVNTT